MAAGGESSEEKTEQPTDRRLEKAFEQGEIQLPHDPFLFALVVVGIAFAAAAPLLAGYLKGFTGYIYDVYPTVGGGLLSAGRPDRMIADLMSVLAIGVLASTGVMLVVVILIALALRRFRMPFKEIKPSVENLSPAKGIARIFGSEGLLRNCILAAKALLLAGVIAWVGRSLIGPAHGFVHVSLDVDLARRIGAALMPIIVAMVVMLALFAGGDFGLRYFQNRKRLRMSKQDIREEVKEQEGDPHIKARIDRIRRERRRKGQHSLKDADVVLTNPTHYAIGLKYEESGRRAPFVVAKGAGLLARWIMRRARSYGIPVLRYPKVTRRIYFTSSIDDEIPDEVFEDVARILLIVYAMKKQAPAVGVR